MSLKFNPVTDGAGDVPLLEAATILLMRDTAGGIEVLMMLRNIRSDFVGGAYVFPGGGIDEADGDDVHRERCRVIAVIENSFHALRRCEKVSRRRVFCWRWTVSATGRRRRRSRRGSLIARRSMPAR